MVFEKTQTFNWVGALRGMRNPKNSWEKSDTSIIDDNLPHIGANDLRLAKTLIKSGTEHRKFLRQIFVCVDITAPLYWWKEFDTYKVSTVSNSCSTIHKLASTPITIDNFEMDDFHDVSVKDENMKKIWKDLIDVCEGLRLKYDETLDKRYWKELIRLLPESWLQKRTITLNYENLLGICSKGQRRLHKLNEWSGKDYDKLPNFIKWARTLPYAKVFLFPDES